MDMTYAVRDQTRFVVAEFKPGLEEKVRKSWMDAF